jgi:penicillin-binding protein 1A
MANRRGKGSKKKSARPSLLRRLIKWTFLLGVTAVILGSASVAGIFYYYSKDLPDLMDREDFQPPQMTRVYAAGGELIAEFAMPGGGKRTVIPMEKIPKHVRWSFMAAEDADFMTHSGIDYLGLVRAFYYAIFFDTGLKGTSTITQQVIKNLNLTPERSIERKVKEIILARELEQKLTKEDILWLYLNEIYLGGGVNGVEEASKLYFGKSAEKLELHEAAVLAGITQSPERHSPIKHPENALKRRAFVLRQLRDKGFIDEAAYRQAEKKPLDIVKRKTTKPYLNAAPYFTEYVRKDLIERYGKDKVYTGGMRVHTTLDLDKQLAAERSLREVLRDYDKRHKLYRPIKHLKEKDFAGFDKKQAKNNPQGPKGKKVYQALVKKVDADTDLLEVSVAGKRAQVVLEPRSRILGIGKEAKKLDKVFSRGDVIEVTSAGEDQEGNLLVAFKEGPQASFVLIEPETRDVLAMVGGYSFWANKYDHATQAKRQTGSTFKPFVYAAALEEKIITPASIYLDTPKTFKLDGGKTYTPRNSDGKSRGKIRIREGIGASRNVVAVRVLDELGVDKAIAFAKKVGIEGKLVKNITMVMGSSELTNLEMVNSYATFASGGYLAKPRFITRIETMRGETETFSAKREQVLAAEVAYLISDLMIAVTQGYTDRNGTRRLGTGSNVNKLGDGMAIAGKTGTTNEARDAWFMGFTPYYVGGAWVGYDNNQPLGRKEYGGRVAAPIWLGAMQAAHKGKKAKKFEPPKAGITTAQIDPATGKLTRQGGIIETFLTGTAPQEYADESVQSTNDFFLNQLGQDGGD